MSIKALISSATNSVADIANLIGTSSSWASQALSEHSSRWENGKQTRDLEYSLELKEREEVAIASHLKHLARYESQVSEEQEQMLRKQIQERISSWG